MRMVLLSTLFAASLLAADQLVAQVHATEAPAPPTGSPTQPPTQPMDRSAPQPAQSASRPAVPSLADSTVFRLEDMPVRTSANGSQSRTITHGTLRTGESVNLHESTQPAATDPVALHVIHHTEFVCVQAGELTFDHVDATGQTVSQPAGPGSVIYVAEGTNHRIRNTGSTPASYIVVAIGGDAK